MVAMRPLGFPGRTVPALKLDGTRVQTNRRIARFLDRLQADPALVPASRRIEIEEAERFADEVVQSLARRLVLAAGRRDLGSLDGDGAGGRLEEILAHSRRRRSRAMRLGARFFGISDETESLDLAALPKVLDRVDALIDAGVLNGDELNAADFQIAPSIALLAYRSDLRAIEGRPAWALVERLLPDRDSVAAPDPVAVPS
jgi:glutathione S-transferase